MNYLWLIIFILAILERKLQMLATYQGHGGSQRTAKRKTSYKMPFGGIQISL